MFWFYRACKMTRHSKNCTAGSVYTYHEKKRDTAASGYGSNEVRFGKDSLKDFDCCSLTLQPCKDPVITPDGHLYDKEAILEYILHQKREIARKLKQFEKQKKGKEDEAKETNLKEHSDKVQKFDDSTRATGMKEDSTQPSTSSVSNMTADKGKELPSFWIPSLTPQATKTELKKPDEKVRCPMSGKPLKLKDLIPVKFTLMKDDDDKRSLIVKRDARYVCAVTNDALGNSVPCALLRTSGNVVTMECVEKIIKKDMIDPTNGKPLKEKDIIQFQRGATGFAGSGIKLKGKIDGAVMQA
ncbi:nitric oxide synthase-interacting protein isoform X1 [Lingula anatina]|uniref:Nitric oxide synthase-interacting protein isoform X1 n=2 Tax=Lingula anatina TaxID=7574 RepID=A0A1S3H908_LINAN|nr:nitric oxide synthase-interacting protein isoform X1 [Lingula anatina]|eukprot:XP_013381609.1 nitric oxide synthase-interacting protein isoform X1 [Lingula anatina]